MKKTAILLFSFLTALTACRKTEPYTGDFENVLIYVESAYNNLSGNERRNLAKELTSGAIPDVSDKNAILAFTHNTKNDREDYDTKTSPCLVRVYRRSGKAVLDTLKVYPADMVDTDAMNLHDVMQTIKTNFPSKHYGMLYSSHGSGWIPPQMYSGGYPAPRPKSIGSEFDGGNDYTYEIELKDFAAAIPVHLDYLIFDACLMGSIEVAYQLKDKCDFIVGSPVEILSAGMHYETMAEHLLGKQPDLEGVCRDYINNCGQGAVALYDCSKLTAIARACASINSKYRHELASVDANEVQRYYRKTKAWFYDLKDIYTAAGVSETDMDELETAIQDAVLYESHTEMFLEIEMKRCCGFSMYLPKMGIKELDAYYHTLKWNKDSGLVE